MFLDWEERLYKPTKNSQIYVSLQKEQAQNFILSFLFIM